MTYRILDLFCCAGGASTGLSRAGFEVTGVDIRPQPHYPFKFLQADALSVALDDFDCYWASPPCQRYSELVPVDHRDKYPDLIAPIRERLVSTGRPYVIENVDGARRLLKNPFRLCGTQFGLNVYRHRWFELVPEVLDLMPPCDHSKTPVKVSGRGNKHINGVRNRAATVVEKREAMGIPYMNLAELTEAIPPAYAEYIGRLLLSILNNQRGIK
jgi:DNA (cytosine-5)-methyltransferase 1